MSGRLIAYEVSNVVELPPAVAPAAASTSAAPQQQSPVVAVAPASAAAASAPQQQSAVVAVAPASAAAASAPQQQSAVMAVAPAAAAAAYALQQQSSVVPAKSGGTRKAKAKAAPKPLSAASRFLAGASASLHQPTRRVPASLTVSLTGDLCQVPCNHKVYLVDSLTA